MRQYTNTYRITISNEMKQKIDVLGKYKIKPTSFIRKAIEEKLARDMKFIKSKKEKDYCPF